MVNLSFARIPHEWDTALENGMFSGLFGLMNSKPEGMLGVIEVYIEENPEDEIYEYWLPVVKKEDNSGSINN